MRLQNKNDFLVLAERLEQPLVLGTLPLAFIKKKTTQLIEDLEELLFVQFCSLEKRVSQLEKAFLDLSEILLEIEAHYQDEWSKEKSESTINLFFDSLPRLQEELRGDVEAAYRGDPSTYDRQEIVVSFPSIKVLTHHRIAHSFFNNRLPLIPRLISEISHQKTGIDIHPGAHIGAHCFIDHGTGVVIGETAVIGDNCTLYQGVTLGAKSFRRNSDGTVVKGTQRHPKLEDHVTVYAGATVLGPITVGHHSIIGGNVWLTNDLPPHSRIQQSRFQQNFFTNGDGI